MSGFDWKGLVATVAPTIAGAFGSPIAGVGVKMALEALGITPESGSEEAQLEQAMKTATPDQLLALKKADNTFKLEMARLGVQNTQGARDLAKSTGIWPQVILSCVYTIAYGIVLYFFMTGQLNVQPDQKILFGSLIGILTGAQVQILNFWFGSSAGSKEKTQAMAAR